MKPITNMQLARILYAAGRAAYVAGGGTVPPIDLEHDRPRRMGWLAIARKARHLANKNTLNGGLYRPH